MPGLGTAIGAAIGIVVGAGVGGLRGHLAGNRALSENAADKTREEEELAKQKIEQARLFNEETHPQLEMKRALLNYDMKSVRALQDQVSFAHEKQRALGAGFSPEEAEESAGNKVALERRQRAGQFAGLINARDGARDVARIAALAGDVGGGQVFHRELQALHQTVKRQGADALPITDWSQGR